MPETAHPCLDSQVLVLARKSLGGIHVFWDNVRQNQSRADVVFYADAARTGYNSEAEVFEINRFDPLDYVYRKLRDHLNLARYTALVANEGFELGFYAWLQPKQTVHFIVHVNHEHSYAPAQQHAALIDHHWCVSETGAAYLRARGLAHVRSFDYSTFIPPRPPQCKQQKVIYVGRFDADKNIIETMDLLDHLRTAGYAVRMIGNGSRADWVRERMAPEECLIGVPRERVFQELADSRFVCHTSYVEGLPIIHTEAMHFGCGLICNYVDKSIHRVTGNNTILWHDPVELLEQMQRFEFSPPPQPVRVNNPALNEIFLRELASAPRHHTDRHPFAPRGLLDRRLFVPSNWIRNFRTWRWLRNHSSPSKS